MHMILDGKQQMETSILLHDASGLELNWRGLINKNAVKNRLIRSIGTEWMKPNCTIWNIIWSI